MQNFLLNSRNVNASIKFIKMTLATPVCHPSDSGAGAIPRQVPSCVRSSTFSLTKEPRTRNPFAPRKRNCKQIALKRHPHTAMLFQNVELPALTFFFSFFLEGTGNQNCQTPAVYTNKKIGTKLDALYLSFSL